MECVHALRLSCDQVRIRPFWLLRALTRELQKRHWQIDTRGSYGKAKRDEECDVRYTLVIEWLKRRVESSSIKWTSSSVRGDNISFIQEH